ncbi:hypothetical protein SAMN05444159_1690 [Bradyrhizobium lablabi]|uniref:Secreted protein n=1 Tax=Bradyrhizobium lablabi TaxID=722472 RepID=A0A1M6MPD7_9BRAD|nr:hypothetical protein SAMN05444159_1690 [Bradyrhizobium lablabi]
MIVVLAVLVELFLVPQLAVAAPVAWNGFEQAKAATASPVSFWGRPFPYGYTGWGPCVRYERLETERGIIFRRVWICSPSEARRRSI